MKLPQSLNTSMDGILNNHEIWRGYGVFVTTLSDNDGLRYLIKLFESENPLYRLSKIDIVPQTYSSSIRLSNFLKSYSYDNIFLAHNKNNAVVSLHKSRLESKDGYLKQTLEPYVNKGKSTAYLEVGANDSLYFRPNGIVEIHDGRLIGLMLGYTGKDTEAKNYTHHLPHELLATDPVQPDFGCGDKKNHYSKYSVYQGGNGRIPKGDPRLRPLPEGMLEPNFSDVYGAHFVTIAKSPVHSHEIGEIYFGGDGVLFVYDNQLEKVIALELNPDTVLYLSKEHRGRPPIHGAVARDLDNPSGVWVIVPDEWQAETKYDTQQDIKPTKQHDGRITQHLGNVIEDRLPRPMNEAGQFFAANVFQYSK